MNDDVQSELLDAEFRQILIAIKPHINDINDHYHLERYRVWLERLSNAHYSEKAERNRYLLELANQIHENVLEPPFTYDPPKGLLPRKKTYYNIPKVQDPRHISEPLFQEDYDQTQWPYISPRYSQEPDPSPRKGRPNTSTLNQKKKPVKTNNKTVKPFQNLGTVGQGEGKKSDSSSWCDLTESTSVTQGCGDTDYEDDEKKLLETPSKPKKQDEEKKLVAVQHKLEALKTKELYSKKYEEEKKETTQSKVSQSKTSQSSSFNVQQFLAEEKTNRKPTPQELEALKMRMKDLLEVKNALKDTHCLTEDRKKAIELLQTKLSYAEQQNAELKILLEQQQKKLVELDKAKNKELSEFKEKFSLLRQKEVEYLKQYHKDEITSLEKTHSSKLSEMQAKIDSLTKEYDEKIKDLTNSNLSLLWEKEKKIEELQSELKTKESQPIEQANSQQIINLKKCLSKLDKALHRNEKDYSRKIEKLKQELDIKEVTSQTQKADIIVRTSAAKQEELKNALNSLEAKYKKMMETLQIHAIQSKRQDDRLIDELKALLQKNNIIYPI